LKTREKSIPRGPAREVILTTKMAENREQFRQVLDTLLSSDNNIRTQAEVKL
jgi:hypothetical protein